MMNERQKQSNAAMNKEIARKFYERIANKQYDRLFELCDENFVYYPQVHTRLEGLQAFIDHERANMDPAGDFKMKVERIAADGDFVAVYLTFEGTLLGNSWHGVPTPKKHIMIDFMTWLTFNKEGKIIEKRAKYDRYDIFKQLGVTNLPLK